MERVAARGAWGTVEWAVTVSGDVVAARAEFLALSEENQAKVNAIFKLLAETGRVINHDKFRRLGEKSKGKDAQKLFEFKSFQDRFIGDFRPGRRFIIGAYANKKKDKLAPEDVERAVKALRINDERERCQKVRR